MTATIESFFDPKTWTLSYLVYDPATKDAAVVDPVLDYDPIRVKVSDDSVRKIEARVRELGLKVHWVLETHVHADHLTGAGLLRKHLGAKIAISEKIKAVQEVFVGIFQIGDEVPTDGRQFDRLVGDGDVVEAGSLRFRAITTPGHTPACVSWHIGDAVFTGDALFMPDQGTGRCDFPAGSAEQLYDSVQKLYRLPPETRLYVGHDYQPNGRELRYQTTVAEERDANIQLRGDTDRDTFVKWRKARDATLNLPNLIFQSLQVNVRAGDLPAPHDGQRYLKMPLNRFDGPVPE